jgi:hypothetical protein
MWILLASCFSFKRRADGFGSNDEILIGDVGCRARASVPRINKLDGAHRSNQRDGSSLNKREAS